MPPLPSPRPLLENLVEAKLWFGKAVSKPGSHQARKLAIQIALHETRSPDLKLKSCCLLDSYHVLGTVLSASLASAYSLTLNSHNNILGSVLFSPTPSTRILQLKKQSREVKEVAQHHTVKWGSQDLIQVCRHLVPLPPPPPQPTLLTAVPQSAFQGPAGSALLGMFKCSTSDPTPNALNQNLYF